MKSVNIFINNENRKSEIIKLTEMFSSSHLNVLLGSGFSMPLLKVLANIEKDLSDAIEKEDKEKQAALYRTFFEGSMLPLIKKKDNVVDKNNRDEFIRLLHRFADTRDCSTLHKNVNIFTTNYDNLIETALENNKIPYFDGFEGRSPAIFSTINYGKVFGKQSSITNRSTEITAINLYKLHGSLFWHEKNGNIIFEDFRRRLSRFAKNKKSAEDYIKEYTHNFLLINPTKEKLNSTLLNINYYDQLRLMSNELEKQNSILLCFGFSFADEHIYTIIERTLKTNPTLTLLLFAYSKQDLTNFESKFKDNNNCICYFLKENDQSPIINFSLKELINLMQEVEDEIK